VKAYTRITGVPANSLVWKNKCLSCVGADDYQEVVRGPLVTTTTVLVPNSVSCVALDPQLLLWRLHWLLSVRYVTCCAFRSSTFCLTQTLLQLLKRISVRLLSSTGTSTNTTTSTSTSSSTSTSTRLLQVPMINSMSSVRHVCISLSFGHN